MSNHVQYPYRNSAYLISRSATQKLLDKVLPFRMASDNLTGHNHITGIKSYGCTPRLVTTGIFESTIWQGETPWWHANRLGAVNRMKRLIKDTTRQAMGEHVYFRLVRKWHELRHRQH